MAEPDDPPPEDGVTPEDAPEASSQGAPESAHPQADASEPEDIEAAASETAQEADVEAAPEPVTEPVMTAPPAEEPPAPAEIVTETADEPAAEIASEPQPPEAAEAEPEEVIAEAPAEEPELSEPVQSAAAPEEEAEPVSTEAEDALFEPEPEPEPVAAAAEAEEEPAALEPALFDTVEDPAATISAAEEAAAESGPAFSEWIATNAPAEPDAIEEVEAEIVARAPVVFASAETAEPAAAPTPPAAAPPVNRESAALGDEFGSQDTGGGESTPAPEPAFALKERAIALWATLKARTLAAADSAHHALYRTFRTPDGGWRFQMPHLRAPGAPSWRGVAIFAGGSFAAVIIAIAAFFMYVTWGMPSTKDLWAARDVPSLTFVDRHGRVIIREGAQNAPPVDLDNLPKYVPEAIIAIEDRRFYEHWGVDFSGLMRASAANMKAGRVVQGGSTLTQQLAKNLFLTSQRSFRRKAQEVALAFWLESQFSKKEILALYMSRVYFGAGAWGIEAAAERYFDKPARQLTLSEAALLAGLLKAPSRLNPASQDTLAKARAKIVLDEMLAAAFITQKEHTAALKAPLSISRSNPNGNLGYFRDWIDPQLNRVIGDQRDDFIIETTLDLEAQRTGEHALDTILETDGKPKDVGQGALVALDSDGGVRAMVGGRGYGKGEGQSEFNRTTMSRRSPGSSFKYFIYMAAMATGNYSPWTVRVDQPVVIGDWAPGNYEDKFYGPVTLAQAYAKSLNMVAIEVAHEVGGDAVIEMAQRLGVRTKLYNYRSLALGAQGLSLMEMTTAYGAMANDGKKIEPHGIARVKRANGQVVWAYRVKEADPVIDEHTKRLMNFLGSRVVQAGTGTRAQIPDRQIAGKTGTSNDYRDAWFIGYVPGLVAGVWVGNDNFAQMKKVTGGTMPTQIWHDFMVTAVRDTPFKPLDLPREIDFPSPEMLDVSTDANGAPTLTTTEGLPYAMPAPAIAPIVPPISDGGDG